MKKLLSKSLFAIAGLLSLSTLAGCGGGTTLLTDPDNHIYINDQNVATTGYEDVNVKGEYFEGVHDFTYTKTNKVFIKKGQTDYKIVVPENTPNDIGVARDELTHFF